MDTGTPIQDIHPPVYKSDLPQKDTQKTLPQDADYSPCRSSNSDSGPVFHRALANKHSNRNPLHWWVLLAHRRLKEEPESAGKLWYVVTFWRGDPRRLFKGLTERFLVTIKSVLVWFLTLKISIMFDTALTLVHWYARRGWPTHKMHTENTRLVGKCKQCESGSGLKNVESSSSFFYISFMTSSFSTFPYSWSRLSRHPLQIIPIWIKCCCSYSLFALCKIDNILSRLRAQIRNFLFFM